MMGKIEVILRSRMTVLQHGDMSQRDSQCLSSSLDYNQNRVKRQLMEKLSSPKIRWTMHFWQSSFPITSWTISYLFVQLSSVRRDVKLKDAKLWEMRSATKKKYRKKDKKRNQTSPKTFLAIERWANKFRIIVDHTGKESVITFLLFVKTNFQTHLSNEIPPRP